MPFVCGWALERAAFQEVSNNDMPQDLGELLELHGTRLEYREMRALAELFTNWAIFEDVTEEQRARLLRNGAEFARLADFCGPDWQPRNRDEQQLDLLRFIAQDALIDNDERWRSDRAKVAEEFLEALATKMTALLEGSPNPDQFAMKIREVAEKTGIVRQDSKIRALPYSAFSRDLLIDNAVAQGWAMSVINRISPDEIVDEASFVSCLQ